MLKGLIGSVIAVGLSSSPIINKPISDSLVSPSTQAVIYDDNLYTITLTTSELNYTYNNLNTLLVNNTSLLTDLITSGLIDTFSSRVLTSYEGFNTDTNYKGFTIINTSGNPIGIGFNHIPTNNIDLPQDNKFHVRNNDTDYNSITLTINSIAYDEIKSAIELDIQANQPAENNMPSVTDLFGYITQGVNAFIGSLGQAFESVVALFWDSTATTPAPTFLGLLMLISIGAGLIFLAYRVIKRLVYRVRG